MVFQPNIPRDKEKIKIKSVILEKTFGESEIMAVFRTAEGERSPREESKHSFAFFCAWTCIIR